MADGQVDVVGLGRLPAHFTKTFDGVNIANGRAARRHNEGDYDLTCKRNWLFKDRFTIAGHDQKSQYRLDLDFDAWSGSPLWGKGKVVLTYDKASRNWRIQTFKRDGTKWEMCNPEAILDIIAGRNTNPGQTSASNALECFNAGSDAKSLGITPAIAAIAAGLRAQRSHIIAQVPRYEGRSDCHAEISDRYDGFVLNPYGP